MPPEPGRVRWVAGRALGVARSGSVAAEPVPRPGPRRVGRDRALAQRRDPAARGRLVPGALPGPGAPGRRHPQSAAAGAAAPDPPSAAAEPAPCSFEPVGPGPSPDGRPSSAPRPTGLCSPLEAGSVVTRCQSSTISNGRWTIEQAWWDGTAAGSSLGSRTRTRRPSKADRTRSMAWVRRGVGRSMTTASTVSAASADQAWMVRSSVTRPVPWSSALRARPSEGSRRSSTTWRDIRGAPTWWRRRRRCA